MMVRESLCEGMTDAGLPCKCTAIADGYCTSHHPVVELRDVQAALEKQIKVVDTDERWSRKHKLTAKQKEHQKARREKLHDLYDAEAILLLRVRGMGYGQRSNQPEVIREAREKQRRGRWNKLKSEVTNAIPQTVCADDAAPNGACELPVALAGVGPGTDHGGREPAGGDRGPAASDLSRGGLPRRTAGGD